MVTDASPKQVMGTAGPNLAARSRRAAKEGNKSARQAEPASENPQDHHTQPAARRNKTSGRMGFAALDQACKAISSNLGTGRARRSARAVVVKQDVPVRMRRRARSDAPYPPNMPRLILTAISVKTRQTFSRSSAGEICSATHRFQTARPSPARRRSAVPAR